LTIQDEIVANITGQYKDDFRYLVAGSMQYPNSATGLFHVKQSGYVRDTLKHITDVETQICLNQMVYAAFAQAIVDKAWERDALWNPLVGLDMPIYEGLMKDHMFIRESHKKFRRQINPAEPFYGTITLEKTGGRRGLYFAELSFSLADNSATGALSLAMNR